MPSTTSTTATATTTSTSTTTTTTTPPTTPSPPTPLLLDVRTPQEYHSHSHPPPLPTAHNIPHTNLLSPSSARTALSALAHIPDNAAGRAGVKIDLYCRSGRRSALAAEALRGMGFGGVRDLGGLEGLEGLRREGVDGGMGKGGVVLDEQEERGEEVDMEGLRRGTDMLVEGLRGLE
ncbi:hypothetical protein K490DRAFT_66642 [Saccharata proteae CBS 121410]|uniref:Rhodanese domain-containing protein n=1 Tax=Saccharata proteae CBS 121410 TaxID=1314787 RepID=A0A9P4LVX2_9PEZI|nr:hypothetical protein K490DRAFT_66642 [Saccharata proteae CBS 121410]